MNEHFGHATSKLEDAIELLQTRRDADVDAALRLVEDAGDEIRLVRELRQRDDFLLRRQIALNKLERRYNTD